MSELFDPGGRALGLLSEWCGVVLLEESNHDLECLTADEIDLAGRVDGVCRDESRGQAFILGQE